MGFRGMNREAARDAQISTYGAELLMPDPEGIKRVRKLIALNAKKSHGRTVAEDATEIMGALGILPSQREDKK